MQSSVNMCGLENSGEVFLCIYLGSPKFREVHRSSRSRQGPEPKSRKRALCLTPPPLYYATPGSSLCSPGLCCYHLLTAKGVRSFLKTSQLEIARRWARAIHGLEWACLLVLGVCKPRKYNESCNLCKREVILSELESSKDYMNWDVWANDR